MARSLRGLCALALCVAACSSFVGITAPVDGGALDADVSGLADAPVRDVTAPRDFSQPADACFAGCDPITDACCAGGLACVVVDESQFAHQCGETGPMLFGQRCDARAVESRCQRGLQCLGGLCMVPCAGPRDASRCAPLTRGVVESRCAVPTVSIALYACTLAGACDYQTQRGCSAAQQCRPTSINGLGVCDAVGAGMTGDRCTHPEGCASGFTCHIHTGTVGACAPRCNPDKPMCAAAAPCGRFEGTPSDWGYCQ